MTTVSRRVLRIVSCLSSLLLYINVDDLKGLSLCDFHFLLKIDILNLEFGY